MKTNRVVGKCRICGRELARADCIVQVGKNEPFAATVRMGGGEALVCLDHPGVRELARKTTTGLVLPDSMPA